MTLWLYVTDIMMKYDVSEAILFCEHTSSSEAACLIRLIQSMFFHAISLSSRSSVGKSKEQNADWKIFSCCQFSTQPHYNHDCREFTFDNFCVQVV